MSQAKVELLVDSSQVKTATNDLKNLAAQGAKTESSTASIEKKFNAAGKAVSAFGIELSKADQDLGRFIGSSGRVHEATGKFVTGMLASGQSVKTLNEAIRQASGEYDKNSNSAGKGTENLRRLGRSAGQVGIQFSQLVGQVQGGTSAFVALSQQAADIGFVLGAPLLGAIVSISAAFGGMIASLYDTEDAADKANDSLKRLKETQTEFKPTVTISIISELNSKFDESQQVTSKLTKQQEFLRKAINESSGDMRKGYIDALARVEYQLETQRGIQSDLAKKIEETTAASLESAATDGDVAIAAERAAETKKRLTEQLTVQKTALEQGEVAAQLYSAAILLGAESVDKLDPKIKELITSTNRLKEAQRSAAEELRASSDDDLAKLADDAEKRKELSKEVAKELIADSNDYLAQLETEYQAKNAFSQLQAQQDPLEAERQRYEKQLEIIDEYLAQEGANQIAAYQAQEQAKKEHEKRMTEIGQSSLDAQSRAQSAAWSMGLQLAGNLFGQLADTIAAAKGKESGAYKAAFLASKASAIAMAVLQTELAATTALAPPPFGLGPVAGVPYSNIIRGLGYASVGLMAGQAIGEVFARAAGGQVSSGSSYLVGERGPELFTPSSSGAGRITPFNQLMNAANDSGQGNAPVINIANYGGQAEVQSTRYSEADRRWIIDIVAGDMQARGKTHSAITRSTTAGNRSV